MVPALFQTVSKGAFLDASVQQSIWHARLGSLAENLNFVSPKEFSHRIVQLYNRGCWRVMRTQFKVCEDCLEIQAILIYYIEAVLTRRLLTNDAFNHVF